MTLKNIDIDILGQIADLKEIDYKNMLALAALVELLIDKKIITAQEIAGKTRDLELANLADITLTLLRNRKRTNSIPPTT